MLRQQQERSLDYATLRVAPLGMPELFAICERPALTSGCRRLSFPRPPRSPKTVGSSRRISCVGPAAACDHITVTGKAVAASRSIGACLNDRKESTDMRHARAKSRDAAGGDLGAARHRVTGMAHAT